MLILAGNAVGPVYALLGNVSASVIAIHLPVSALAIWSLSHVCIAAFNRERWSADRHPVRFYSPAVEG